MAQLKSTTVNGNLTVTGNVTTTYGADLNVLWTNRVYLFDTNSSESILSVVNRVGCCCYNKWGNSTVEDVPYSDKTVEFQVFVIGYGPRKTVIWIKYCDGVCYIRHIFNGGWQTGWIQYH